MCKLCDIAIAEGNSAPVHLHPATPAAGSGASGLASSSRRSFLRGSAAAGVATALTLNGGDVFAQTQASPLPAGVGQRGRRTLIRGAAVLSMDPAIGNFSQGDILLEGNRIVSVGARIPAADAAVIDASGMVVMPGFIDTHHHQFETALRSFLADGVLFSDGRPETRYNYFETILQKFAAVYRPEDVYINELYGSLSQLDAGVTTVMDVSQIHHSPEHTDAAIEALRAAGRRAAFGYFEGQAARTKYPSDAYRIRSRWFSSNDQLVSMVMGGEIYLPGHETAWQIGRELNVPIALHVVGPFDMQETFDKLGAQGRFGPDNIFIHMSGMSKAGWRYAADAGAHVSLAVPIEMQMRHGTPPILQALDLGIQPSLSTDVECTMTADSFTQMRSALTLQRMFANEKALNKESYPKLLTAHDAIRFATIEGARGLNLADKTGSLTPGKEADIILLDATSINVKPLNHVPGAVVTLMDRSNVSTVLVAGKIRKWRGKLVGVDLHRLGRQLESSRDYLFKAADIPRDLFRS